MFGILEKKISLDLRVFGVYWNFMKDILIFDLVEIVNYVRDFKFIKRNVVSIVVKFYDFFGFLLLIIIEFKLFF